jgi:assimilatory nitrate reductase catalytic subunit
MIRSANGNGARPMMVCICKAVSDTQLNAAIASGASSVAALGEATGAGTDCGCCRRALGQRLERLKPPEWLTSSLAESDGRSRAA